MRLVRLFTLLAFSAFFFTRSVQAQVKVAVTPYGPQTAFKQKECLDPFPAQDVGDIAVNPVNIDLPVSFRAGSEFPIGTTVYDYQTNASMGNRLSRGADGSLMGVWTMAQDPALGDRGTGYNRQVDGVWGDQPGVRLESVRTGWPSHVATENGTELTIAHDGTNQLVTMRREAGSSTWTEGVMTSNIYPAAGGPGLLWPRAAASGNTIHVIALTTPSGNGGAIYEGLDPHPLYYRSTDAGATWDKVDVILPGLDSTEITDMAADGYSIHANGQTVAIAFFDEWQDVILMKSSDNGETWTKTVVNDHPLDRYVINTGYSFEDLPPMDPNSPDSLAIFTSDGTGTVLVDNDGMAHVAFGPMWVVDDDLTDAGWTFFPGTSGLQYWNESFGADSLMTIADVVDQNGNDTLDIGGIDNYENSYGFSLTAQPTAGIDADGNIFISYTAIMESDLFLNLEDNQYYRHVYVVASQDGGATWTEPYDVINPDVVFEPDLANFMEAVYPCISANVGETVDLLYQQDFRPGNAQNDGDARETNFINHISLDPMEDLGLVSNTEEAVPADYFKLEVQPNPARNEALVSFELENNARYTLSLLNIMGQKVADIETANGLNANQVRLNVSNLNQGVYLLRLQAGDKVAVTKLMVQ
ncbi:MAG: T9SS type A sorting domain-containing protein [Phaeodactylibacter sp.]|nr:T9SS type A sorting domain-containing protein [Phaeodactylibacter sp.]MCB9292382.1 T9SS type A sorting domain-containing protein [Lewinellaceae bacterium]